jgi:hypothetical protein
MFERFGNAGNGIVPSPFDVSIPASLQSPVPGLKNADMYQLLLSKFRILG